jgi:hypothetical protein
MTKVPKNFRFDPDLLDRIDEVRGDVSLTAWIERACRMRLNPASGPSIQRQAHASSVPMNRQAQLNRDKNKRASR